MLGCSDVGWDIIPAYHHPMRTYKGSTVTGTTIHQFDCVANRVRRDI